jgi:hypothetical protein
VLQLRIVITGVLLASTAWGAGDRKLDIAAFRLRTPGDKGDINQASDLHFGALGDRVGLWTACDRNGGATAGKIYFFSTTSLRRAEPGKNLVADEEFTITPPAGEWSAFAAANRAAGDKVLDEVRRRIVGGADRTDEPYLDLECITIAPSPLPPHEQHLFVVAEEPYSTVLELELPAGETGHARLVALYAYHEKPSEQGVARNDGLEGFAYAGTPGQFYFAEEGTRDCGGNPNAFLFFCDPRLGRAKLADSNVIVEEPLSSRLTEATWRLRKGPSQTLNGLCVLPSRRVLAVDRNGGLILMADPDAGTVRPWLDLYDLEGVSLRKLLANFPGPRHMPYVSIEGVAVDDAGGLWLVDDPAIPEPFRNSCAVRIRGLEKELAGKVGAAVPATVPATQPGPR